VVAESLVALTLVVSWNPVTVNCKGLPLLTPVDHYEVPIFEARIVGTKYGMPVYTRSVLRTTIATSVDVADPNVGEVIGWAGMWDNTYSLLQNPPVVAVSLAGNRCDQSCP
jgi:hypothetical protein